MTATFVVETGAGLSTANAFCSVADVTDYNDNHDRKECWPPAEPERAIRLATQYLVLLGRGRWRGARWTELQALPFPRTDIRDEDGYYIKSGSNTSMPQILKDATAELAIAVADGDTLLEGFEPMIQAVSISNEAKSESVSYAGPNQDGATKRYPRVEMGLRPLLHPGPLMETC